MGTFIPDGWFRAGAKEAGMKGWRESLTQNVVVGEGWNEAAKKVV